MMAKFFRFSQHTIKMLQKSIPQGYKILRLVNEDTAMVSHIFVLGASYL